MHSLLPRCLLPPVETRELLETKFAEAVLVGQVVDLPLWRRQTSQCNNWQDVRKRHTLKQWHRSNSTFSSNIVRTSQSSLRSMSWVILRLSSCSRLLNFSPFHILNRFWIVIRYRLIINILTHSLSCFQISFRNRILMSVAFRSSYTLAFCTSSLIEV